MTKDGGSISSDRLAQLPWCCAIAAAPGASCALPEAQGERPACPLPRPKNPLNADSGFGNGACCAGASATADEAGGVSATRICSRFTRLGLCLTALERLAMLLPAV